MTPPPSDSIPDKICTQCKLPKSINEFERHYLSKDGHHTWCRACRRAAQKKRYWENREEDLKRQKEYRQKNPEKQKKRYAEYRSKNKEKLLKAWAEYRSKTKEKRAEANRRYWKEHKDRLRAIKKKWKTEHRDKVRDSCKKRYAARRGAEICDFTREQWIEMQEVYGHRCAYCGRPRRGKLTQDHITPVSKGGNHTLSNIVPACRSCNSKKHDGAVLSPVQPMLLV